jgi:Coenzyme PQQ synthesis protein D (PqqD)
MNDRASADEAANREGAERLRLRSRDLTWLEVEGEIVALDLKESVYIAVNSSGAVLWPELSGGATRDQLVKRLRDEFGLERAAALHDVDSFLKALREQNLLEQ